jgi:hypothetical protein
MCAPIKHYKILPYGIKQNRTHWIDGNDINKKQERQKAKEYIKREMYENES